MLKTHIDYSVVRTNRRKTASVNILFDKVIVTVPKKLSNQQIQQIVFEKRKWIINKLNSNKNKSKHANEKRFRDGEFFTYLGRRYGLKIKKNSSKNVKLIKGKLVVFYPLKKNKPASEMNVRLCLVEWYKKNAQRILEHKTYQYAKLFSVQPKRISIKDYRSRWGSCNSTGNISFNWRIIIAPSKIIDYLVVHELAHIIHHNHSSKYWKLVNFIYPDYKECRSWLKNYSHNLYF